MFRLLSAAAIVALLGSGCAEPTELLSTTTGDAGTPLPITRLRAEPYSFAYSSGMTDSARLAIRDVDQWQQVWSAIERGSSPTRALPPVDFAQEMLIVAALGTRSSGGFSIYVDSAYQRDDHVEVVVRKVSPGAGCFTTAAFTQPVDIARLPASTLTVRFRERSTVHGCN
jgi:hypothetical protein